jgi:hypothetical protein
MGMKTVTGQVLDPAVLLPHRLDLRPRTVSVHFYAVSASMRERFLEMADGLIKNTRGSGIT